MSGHSHDDQSALRLRVLQNNLATISERLDGALRLLSAISSLSQAPVRAKGPAQAADQMLDVLVRALDNIMNCSVMIYDAGSNQLRMLAVRGQAEFFGDTVFGGSQHLTFRPGEGIAGRVYSEQQPVFWSEKTVPQSPLKVFADSDIPAAIACLPLQVREGCLGVLNLSFSDPMDFTFNEQRNLVLLSQVVANAIHNLILLDQPAAS